MYMYVRNYSGPNTDPCGTPEVTVTVDREILKKKLLACGVSRDIYDWPTEGG